VQSAAVGKSQLPIIPVKHFCGGLPPPPKRLEALAATSLLAGALQRLLVAAAGAVQGSAALMVLDC
jgi:hypothetical protein